MGLLATIGRLLLILRGDWNGEPNLLAYGATADCLSPPVNQTTARE
jgi:hypothetical protein